MIKITNLSFTRGHKPILTGISCDIPRGGITALVGANGAGKSTLLSLIARLLPLQSGAITIDGLDIATTPTDVMARKLAILPQSNTIAPRLSVRDLVGFGRYPHHKGRPRPEDHAIVDRALAAFELEQLSDRFLDNLSGGQRQRVLLAMTHAQDTEFLLLDEPLNNLDLAASRSLMRHLREMAETMGKTIVIVLHDLNVASQYADQVITLHGGRLDSFGPPSTVLGPETIARVFNTTPDVVWVNDRPLIVI